VKNKCKQKAQFKTEIAISEKSNNRVKNGCCKYFSVFAAAIFLIE